MGQYEMVGIIRPDLEPEAVQGVIDRVGRRVVEQGGTVDVVDVWGKRRLIYAIRKYREGIYFLTRFTVDKDALPEIKRQTRIMDEMLRALMVEARGPLPVPRVTGERPAEAAKAPEEPAAAPAVDPTPVGGAEGSSGGSA